MVFGDVRSWKSETLESSFMESEPMKNVTKSVIIEAFVISFCLKNDDTFLVLKVYSISGTSSSFIH